MAILAVLLFHLSNNTMFAPPQGTIGRAIAGVASMGWIGVDLFFALSGFLITGILWESRGSAHPYKNFYARRAVRIFPLYYVSLGLLLLANFTYLRITSQPQLAPEFLRNQWWLWTFSGNWAVAAVGIRALWAPLGSAGHFWSLAVEEQFYLVWPFLMLRLSRRGAMRFCGWVIVIAEIARIILWQLHVNPTAIYMLTPCRADALAIGSLVALYLQDGEDYCSRLTGPQLNRLMRWLALLSIAIIAAVEVVRGELSTFDFAVQVFALTPIAIASAALIVLALSADPGSLFARMLASRTLGALGRYSYGLYVWHWMIYRGVGDLMKRTLHSAEPRWVFGVWACISVVLTFVIAIASFHLLERPFLRMKNRFQD